MARQTPAVTPAIIPVIIKSGVVENVLSKKTPINKKMTGMATNVRLIEEASSKALTSCFISVLFMELTESN